MNLRASVARSDLWETPCDLFAALDAEFRFDLDACASPGSEKCPRYFRPADHSLAQPWRGVVWCNPPYGRRIGRWIQKAWESSQNGATVVCLIPASTDTAWWHDYVMRGEVRFIRGRLCFGNAGYGRAPFPSAVVVFRPKGGE